MTKPLDDLYFVWLYNQVGDTEIKNPSRTYWRLLKQLFTKEFVWLVPNDDNRIEDGKDLRYEFVDQAKLENVDPLWMQLGCSMLEMLIGLSRRFAFEVEGEPRDWFWHLMENVDLKKCNDRRKFSPEVVDKTLERIIWRTYQSNGHGGLFPLKGTPNDQKTVELWYQLSEYILEMWAMARGG